MSLARFLKRFPEFDQEGLDKDLIKQSLAEAKAELRRNHWGKLFVTASHLLAAHKLAISPMGEPCRLENAQEKTLYQLEYERLVKSAFMGAQVL